MIMSLSLVGGRERRDHHRRLGLAEQLAEDRADRLDGLLKPGNRHRRGPVPEAAQGAEVGVRQARMVQ
jgi:hypothetical protein